MNFEVVRVDYSNEKQGADLGYLMNCYSKDPVGGGGALPVDIVNSLATELSKLPHAFSLICYVGGKPAALANCFDGFSTSYCKPLVNLHDLIVEREFRGKGISTLMLEEIEKIALEKGCCKVTLEVLQGNDLAKKSYAKSGFMPFQYTPELGDGMFWQKNL